MFHSINATMIFTSFTAQQESNRNWILIFVLKQE